MHAHCFCENLAIFLEWGGGGDGSAASGQMLFERAEDSGQIKMMDNCLSYKLSGGGGGGGGGGGEWVSGFRADAV